MPDRHDEPLIKRPEPPLRGHDEPEKKKPHDPPEQKKDDKGRPVSEPRSFEDEKKNPITKPNKESNKFKHPETGAVLDATPEGTETAPEPLYEEKPDLNPVTKSYKANFPLRGEELQNYAPLESSDPDKVADRKAEKKDDRKE